MKIIYFHQHFNTPDMSGSTRSFEFAKGLVKMGHEVIMITSYRESYKNKKWFVTEESGIKVNWLPLEYSNHYKILPQINEWAKDNLRIKGGKRVSEGFVYSSDSNLEWMTKSNLKKWIDQNQDHIGKI